MALDDGVPEHTASGSDGWDGAERRRLYLSREVGHYNDPRKIEALLECIEFSGVDLLDKSDKIAFTERLARAKRADERRKRWNDHRVRSMLWIVSTVGTVLVSLWLPEAVKWARSKL